MHKAAEAHARVRFPKTIVNSERRASRVGEEKERAARRRRSSGRTTQRRSPAQARRARRERKKGRQKGIDEKGQQGKRNQVSWGILVLGPGRTARRIVFHNRHGAASLVDHKTVRRQTNTTHN